MILFIFLTNLLFFFFPLQGTLPIAHQPPEHLYLPYSFVQIKSK